MDDKDFIKSKVLTRYVRLCLLNYYKAHRIFKKHFSHLIYLDAKQTLTDFDYRLTKCKNTFKSITLFKYFLKCRPPVSKVFDYSEMVDRDF